MVDAVRASTDVPVEAAIIVRFSSLRNTSQGATLSPFYDTVAHMNLFLIAGNISKYSEMEGGVKKAFAVQRSVHKFDSATIELCLLENGNALLDHMCQCSIDSVKLADTIQVIQETENRIVVVKKRSSGMSQPISFID
jgi:hypothetical protein